MTATELAYRAGVSPPTASSHLAKLVQAKLLAVDVEGRYRHYRLAGPNVGHAVEAILALAGEGEEREEGVRRRLGRDFVLAARGKAFLEGLGVDVEKAERQRRAFARQCLDWTERRPHLAGALGAAFAARWVDLGWVTRVSEERYLLVTERGRRSLRRRFSIRPSEIFVP